MKHRSTLHSRVKWTTAGESRQKWSKMQTSAGKVLASIFRDLFINYLEKGRRVNSIIGVFEGRIAKKQPQMKKKKVHFHHDNALCHKLITMVAKLHELHFKLLLHPHPILQIWPPATTGCLQTIRRMLQGKRFGFNEEVISITEAYFEVKNKLFYKKGI